MISRASRHRRTALVAALAALAMVLAACGGSDNQRPTLASGGTTNDTGTDAPSTTSTPSGATIATAAVNTVEVFDEPDAPEPSRTYENPWHVNDDPSAPTVPLVFLTDEHGEDGWTRVMLPERPNGLTGWVRTSDFTFDETEYSILVELGKHQITVLRGEEVLIQEAAAIGKPETPTPPGKYYIRVLLQSPDPDSVYGPFAYGLSGHSDVLTEFNGGDGELGIHGNNDASVLGQSVSAGCVRMSNDGITQLTTILPLGTPVEIVA